MQVNTDVKQQMFAHVEQWKQSKLNQTQYCHQHGVAYSAFHYWYKRYRLDMAPQPVGGFVPLELQPVVEPAHTELMLTDGRRIVFRQPVSADYLKALIS